MFGYTEKLDDILERVNEIRCEQVTQLSSDSNEKDLWWKLEQHDEKFDKIYEHFKLISVMLNEISKKLDGKNDPKKTKSKAKPK